MFVNNQDLFKAKKIAEECEGWASTVESKCFLGLTQLLTQRE